MQHDELITILAGYEPSSDEERIDLQRIVSLIESGDPWDRSSLLHITGSALVVDRTSRRVLLRWHERQQSWIQVGGHRDDGEQHPLEVALREGREETGLADLAPWPGLEQPIHLAIVPVPANAKERTHEHADIRFVLATDEAHRALPEHDGAPLRWLSFDDAEALTDEANVRETLRRARRAIA